MKNRLKKFFRECFLTKGLYKALWSIRNRKMLKERKQKRRAIQENGIELVHLLQGLLGKEKFFFDMGTLLGIVREGKLLGHDLDVDTGIFIEKKEDVQRIREILLQNGCKLARSYAIEEIGVVEDSFLINGIKFDINYYFREERKDVVYLMYISEKDIIDKKMSVVKLSCSPIDEIEQVDFKGKKINIPKNSKQYLAERYGENWRIPDKNYIYWKGPSAEPTEYRGIVTTSY